MTADIESVQGPGHSPALVLLEQPKSPAVDWQTSVYIALIALIAGFLLVVAGIAIGRAGTIDPGGHTGEVYVPGTGWVAGTDHGAHEQRTGS